MVASPWVHRERIFRAAARTEIDEMAIASRTFTPKREFGRTESRQLLGINLRLDAGRWVMMRDHGQMNARWGTGTPSSQRWR
jgi:hypothetical protein